MGDGWAKSGQTCKYMEVLAREAIESVSPQELEVRTGEGKWHLMRVRPYKTWDDRIEGAVISLQDIDVLKRTPEHAREYANAPAENAREPILVLDGDLRITAANPSFYHSFEVAPEETETRLIYELGNGQWNIPGLRVLLEDIIPKNTRADDFEVEHDFPHLGPRVMRLNARRIESHQGRQLILLAIEDVTEKLSLEALRKKQTALLEMIPGAVIDRSLDGTIRFWSHGAEEMYGWSKDASLGKSSFELLSAEFPRPLKDIEDQLTRTERWEGDLIHTRRDGTRIDVRSRWLWSRELRAQHVRCWRSTSRILRTTQLKRAGDCAA